MTADSSKKLAETLRAAGFHDLAKRAEADEFHDYISQHAMPSLELDSELVKLIQTLPSQSAGHLAAKHIRARHHDGEFDATTEEGDDWMNSPDGRETFRRLLKGE